MAINEQDQWLGLVRPLLGGIRNNANWVRFHSKEVIDKVRLLPYAPSFETEAQAALDDAIKAITEAGEILQRARLDYLAKPIKD